MKNLNLAAADTGIWTHPTTGQVRTYINNWQQLAGIEVDYYGTGRVSSVWIEGYDGRVSNNKGWATIQGRVWVDEDGDLHLDGHSPASLLGEDEKTERILAALA